MSILDSAAQFNTWSGFAMSFGISIREAQVGEKPRVWAVGSELDERKVNASAAKIPASIGTRSFGSNQ
jgi:hypothetical protein